MNTMLGSAHKAVSEQFDHPTPKVGLILGSGLGGFVTKLTDVQSLPYQNIPYMPLSAVPGHAGVLHVGRLGNTEVVVAQGRVHLYEGRTAAEVVFTTDLFAALGVSILVVSNAAGAVNSTFNVGDLMLISDHINLTGANPLTGLGTVASADGGETSSPFVPLGKAYAPWLIALASAAGAVENIPVRTGVYAAMAGPSYETPAEVRMLNILGADAVGMSTVPEVIKARFLNIEVLAISAITNMATGVGTAEHDHQSVLVAAAQVAEKFTTVLHTTLAALP